MVDFTGLEAAVAAQRPGVDSVKAFITELKAQLATELAGDPAAQEIVNKAMNDILQHNQELADAMAATP